VPAVLFDIQRVGPSTGMPTRTQQCDILEGAYASHGDTKHVCLFPRDPEECFYFARDAFDLAERLQTPIMVMSDLDIGMNDWMCPDLKWDDNYVPDRGKVLDKAAIEKLEKFHRYLDVDGDGIPWRTLPGVHPKGAYFTRGSGHTQYGAYTEDSTEYQIVLDRLTRKFHTARRLVPKPAIEQDAHIDIGVVAYGSSDGAVREALDILAVHGIKTNYMRLRAFPFGEEVEKFLEQQKLVFVIEQNRDGQMRSLLTLETRVEKAKLRSLLHYSGLPISSEFIVKGVLAEIEPKTRKPEAIPANKIGVA
jgi:2-oxoglutarate ferredoxin oxidoreductase subunit alpha